jgi:DNA-binding NarL/FixJ family response regulator
MRVLLADGHTQVRWALRTAIREEPGLTVIGEASNAQTLLSQAPGLQPDLILLEWELPGAPIGGALLSALRDLDLQARVVVLGRQPEAELAALSAGADLFVNKAAGPAQLLAALRTLAEVGPATCA